MSRGELEEVEGMEVGNVDINNYLLYQSIPPHSYLVKSSELHH